MTFKIIRKEKHHGCWGSHGAKGDSCHQIFHNIYENVTRYYVLEMLCRGDDLNTHTWGQNKEESHVAIEV